MWYRKNITRKIDEILFVPLFIFRLECLSPFFISCMHSLSIWSEIVYLFGISEYFFFGHQTKNILMLLILLLLLFSLKIEEFKQSFWFFVSRERSNGMTTAQVSMIYILIDNCSMTVKRQQKFRIDIWSIAGLFLFIESFFHSHIVYIKISIYKQIFVQLVWFVLVKNGHT